MKTRVHTYTITVILLLFITNLAKAQLCSGSLGDPIVNITFGSGTNPGPQFSAATTAYVYTSADCPSDGLYAIRNSTTGCFGAWHSIPSDHTGNPNGYFMLVNASYSPSAFYVDTVHGLCSNTTFEFAAWIANVLVAGAGCQPSILPDLTFTIERTDGTVLKTFNTGGIPEQTTFTWQQMGFYFTTPVGVQDVVLRIVNNAGGGCGNDLALDDITFRPCGPTIMANIDGSPVTNLSYCTGSAHTVTFTGNVLSGLANPVMQWQQNVNGAGWQDIPGATSATLVQNYAANQTPGTYEYRLSAVQAGSLSICRTTSQVLTITLQPPLAGTVSSNAPICAGSTLQLSVTGTATYQWSGVNGFTATGNTVSIPNAQTTHSGKYYVQASAVGSCPYLDSVTVTVNPVPTATASPNVSICENDNTQLTAAGGTIYKWIPATGLSADNIANPIATPADTTNYMVIVSTAAGCKDTAYVVVNVGTRLTGVISSNAPICAGNTLQLAVTGPATYQWTGVNGFTATGTAASIPNAQATQSGRYYVRGTAAGTCPYFDSVDVTINPAPTAAVSPDVSICENDNTQLTATGGATYKWIPATGLSADDIANPIATPADTTNYMVIVSTAAACKDTAYVVVNVGTRLTGMVSSNAPICAGNELQLSVTGTAAYQWTGVNGFTATGTAASIPNAQATQSGRYYVQGTATGACPYSDSVDVRINPTPTATVSPDVSICENDNVQLTSSGGDTYKWLPATGLSADNIANPIATPADTTNYMVIVSTTAACKDTAYVVVNVGTRLTGTISTNAPICAGNDLQLSVTGTATYQWNGVNGFTATGAAVSIPNAQSTQSGKYYVQGTIPGTCPYSDSVDVTINLAPTATVGPDVSICENDEVQLTSSGGTTYQWIPSTGLSMDNIANPMASPADTTSYMVIILTAAACRDTGYVTVNVGTRLTGTLTTNAPICAGNELQLSVTGNGAYQWTGVNGFTATGTAVSIPDAQATQSGKYYVGASAAGMCPYADSILVNINPAPEATVSPDVSICKNESTQLISSGGVAYLWLPATGLSANNIANPIANPADTTNYMVIVSTAAACSDTAYVVVNVIPKATVNAGPDQSILKGETATLKGTVTGDNISYTWSPTTYMTDGTSLTPQVSPPADIDYVLSIPADAACGITSDTVHVFVYPDIYVPNAFTPNGDGHNDTWHIPALQAIPVFEVSVFNRWGQLVYHVKNNDIGWDGRFKGINQPSGGYAYILNIGNGKRILKGVVMLLR